MDVVPSLVQVCIHKLAQNLIKYGPKKVRLSSLSGLPWYALEALLEILVAKNALNDNVLPHALTRQTQKLCLEGSSQVRRAFLNTIGRSCPNLRVLDVRACQQVDNRIVRDVLQHCERLATLRLDGCTRVTDSAFAPVLWKPPLAGLLGLQELSIGKCVQVTTEGLLGYVMKGTPFLKTLGLAYCRLTITDEVAAELLFNFALESLDLSFCSHITDAPFQARSSSMLRELRVANTQITDAAVENFARRAPQLEVFDAGWVVRLTDRGVTALAEECKFLRVLCVCNTQITNAAFEVIARCQHLERLDASWCLRATSRALDILSAAVLSTADGQVAASSLHTPALRELKLDHLGGLILDLGGDCLAALPGSASPDLWRMPAKGTISANSSPRLLPWLPVRASSEPQHQLQSQTFALPPPAQPCSPSYSACLEDVPCSVEPLPPTAVGADGMPVQVAQTLTPSASLRRLVSAYASSLEQLLVDGIRDVADAASLQAIAENCPMLRQLALTFPAPGRQGAAAAREADAALEAGLRAVGEACRRLALLRLDCVERPHRPLVAPLAPPSFDRLRSLTLTCPTRGGGLQDEELEAILSERLGLETLELRNCDGLSEGLFPKWCNRERRDEAEVLEQLDQALLSSLSFGYGGAFSVPGAAHPDPAPSKPSRRRPHPRCAPAVALRSLTSFSLTGATALSDRSGDALAELLHDVQTVDVRGCPLLTEESLRSFRKGCRYLRSVSIVTRDRTLSWHAATTGVKRHHHRKSSCFPTSGSSGTESN